MSGPGVPAEAERSPRRGEDRGRLPAAIRCHHLRRGSTPARLRAPVLPWTEHSIDARSDLQMPVGASPTLRDAGPRNSTADTMPASLDSFDAATLPPAASA